MTLDLEVQRACRLPGVPGDEQLARWARTALAGRRGHTELVVRIVDETEITTLNRDYRGKDRPTNVLSFPFDPPPPVHSDLIGDLVICAPVVRREAEEQHKSIQAHWAHLVVHGVLHLLGYDHDTDAKGQVMEGIETEIMKGLGFPDPYSQEP